MGVENDDGHLDSKCSHMGLELRTEGGEEHLLVTGICEATEIIRNTEPSRESSENSKGPRKSPSYEELGLFLNRNHLVYTSYHFGCTARHV